jgi:DNA-binding MarR family transcriptional regulator
MFDEEGMAPSALSEMTGLTRGAISKLIARLVDKRFVSREERSDDRRFQA